MTESIDLKSAIVQQLQSLSRNGVLDLPKANPQSATSLWDAATSPPEIHPEGEPSFTLISARPADTQAELITAISVSTERAAPSNAQLWASDDGTAVPSRSSDARVAALQVLQREVAQCTRCSELVQSRTQTVFGVGNVQPRLCFFGEAPGADEDAQGEPFVGRAGQLLNKIIAVCNMKREDVYILNAIKCRPEGNRTPAESEIENCWEFARRQLEILQPEFICCLGGVAVRSLLKRKESIGKLRQRFFHYGASQVIVTYHPAYLLREPNAKRYVWEDMQMLMKAMGISLA